MRSQVAFDVLRRWLERKGYEVTLHPQRHGHRRQDPGEVGSRPDGRGGRTPTTSSGSSTPRTRPSTCSSPRTQPRATGHIPQMVELDRAADRPRPCVPGRGRVRRRLLRRPLLALVRRADPPEPGRRRAGARRRPPGQARPARLRAVEGRQARRACHRVVADAVGPGPAGVAPGVLGDGHPLPRARLRHPRRRSRPALPAPRERARAVPRRRRRLRALLAAQRMGRRRRREDEQVARQHDDDAGAAPARPPGGPALPAHGRALPVEHRDR